MRAYRPEADDGSVEWMFLTTRDRTDLQPILDGYGQYTLREYDHNGDYTGEFAHLLRVFLDRSRAAGPQHLQHRIPPPRHPHERPGDSVSGVFGRLSAPCGAQCRPASHAFARGVLIAAVIVVQVSARTSGELDSGQSFDERQTRGPGDVKEGYESADYRTRSRSLLERRGVKLDLIRYAQDRPARFAAGSGARRQSPDPRRRSSWDASCSSIGACRSTTRSLAPPATFRSRGSPTTSCAPR